MKPYVPDCAVRIDVQFEGFIHVSTVIVGPSAL